MKFKVVFRPFSGNSIYAKEKRIGLNHLEQVRQYLGLPSFPPDRVTDTVKQKIVYSVRGEVSEQTAKNSGLFLNDCVCSVQVPTLSLNKYLFISYEMNREPTGEVISVIPKWEINTDAILADWASAGYPENWEI